MRLSTIATSPVCSSPSSICCFPSPICSSPPLAHLRSINISVRFYFQSFSLFISSFQSLICEICTSLVFDLCLSVEVGFDRHPLEPDPT
ncbi:hypothetical protein CMV_025610 [Castanea mollissima]|uniref:Uncharacterized protein n=1 Tax=Castanea mollissima TaxID=60419 RepID=A0A8J4VGR7_9ROSI|nr:hypothetical protein CMV_025610 [Castanea mollissima]